jgi:hypothetical protein
VQRHRCPESDPPEGRLFEIEAELAMLCRRFRGQGTLLAPAEVSAGLRECCALYGMIERVRDQLVAERQD